MTDNPYALSGPHAPEAVPVKWYRPKLHALIKHDVPAPEPSIYAAFKRLIPVLIRQLKYKDAVIIPDLPKSATPYGADVETLKPHAV